jgi:hypothetical protein
MKKRPPTFQFAKLLSLENNVHPPEFVLESDICTLGRSAMCDVIVEEQKTVSRLHAKIELDGPRYILHDANSAAGSESLTCSTMTTLLVWVRRRRCSALTIPILPCRSKAG